ncbi:hypothetical protein [Streptomyces griseocarneus]|uniref:hypothetical protein n=1 Tax=Streptomyces griseocarneus TaxID=51201 RepID=UPI00167D1905|nr:hypothetical protein [Streptomyces griseocarneus]MBZ6478037.1 hypothetical protein [Streptomyces griseocarneus]GHG64122.1 hypothetical protein GCM10018779_33830 [Streptomyces griseocarneus]
MSKRSRWAVVATSTAMAVALTACGSDNSPKDSGATAKPSPPPPTARPNATYSPPKPLPKGKEGTPKAGLPQGVDEKDATAVAEAIAVTDWTFDTDLDSSPSDAQRRTMPWLADSLAKDVANAQPLAQPDAAWRKMAEHHGYTVATAKRAYDDQQMDLDTEAYRQFEVTVKTLGRDDWKGPTDTWVQWIHLTRTDKDQPWKADTMRVAK